MIFKLNVDAHVHEGGEDAFMSSCEFYGSCIDLLSACETIIRRVMHGNEELLPIIGRRLIEDHFDLNEEEEDGEQQDDANED